MPKAYRLVYMIKFHGQQKAKKKFYKKVIWAIILLFIVVLIKPTWNIWYKYRTSERELKRTTEEVEKLKQRQVYLEAELKDIGTQEGQEKEVIKKFDLVRGGEKLAVIIDSGEDSVKADSEVGFLMRFFKKYFGWMTD